MLGILNRAFSLVKEEDYDPANPRILPLDKRTREELLLLAILQPMMVTNAGAKIPNEIFASDASLEKGAIVSTEVSPPIFAALFKTARNKGGYTKLMAASERLLEEECTNPIVEPSRPIVTRFGFIEVFAGAALVTEEMKKLGHLVLTPVELSNSAEFNAEFCHVAAWLTHTIANHRVEGYIMEPPCTTFSIMRQPQLRSKEEPLGFNVQDPQTATGTALAHRGLLCVSTGGRYYVPGLLETPFSSKMRHLPSWRRLERRPGISQTRTDSCRFGSPHLKPFRFLGSHTNLEGISKRCRCKEEGRVHIQIQGAYTKASATYTQALAQGLAQVLHSAILAFRHEELSEDKVDGLEDQLVNEVMKSSRWKEEAVWQCREGVHINLLEIDAICKLATRISLSGGSTRTIAMVDSNVTKGASSKGRSSSGAISSYLRRLGSTLVSGDIYMRTPFSPTTELCRRPYKVCQH